MKENIFLAFRRNRLTLILSFPISANSAIIPQMEDEEAVIFSDDGIVLFRKKKAFEMFDIERIYQFELKALCREYLKQQ